MRKESSEDWTAPNMKEQLHLGLATINQMCDAAKADLEATAKNANRDPNQLKISGLVGSIADLAFENMRSQVGPEMLKLAEKDDLSLMTSFVWDQSPEGFYFWRELFAGRCPLEALPELKKKKYPSYKKRLQ